MADAVRSVARKDMYVLEMDDGETWTIPGTNSSIRFVADKSSAPFAIVHSRCMPDAPVPPHFHKLAVDTWLVLQGKIVVWAGDEGRVMCAGDYAFVPPGVIHSYQPLEPHTEFIGLIHPAEWVDFFKAIGELYTAAGPFPSTDSRPFPKDKFIQAIKDGHDVIPQFAHKLTEPKHDWTDAELPAKPQAFFMKAHRGPRYALGGQTCAPLSLSEASEGKFAVSYLEAHKSLQHPKELSEIRLSKGCLVIYVQTGAWNLTIDGQASALNTGDSAYVPAGSVYSLAPRTKFTRAILFSEGAGPEQVFMKAGKLITGVIGSDSASITSETAEILGRVAKEHGIEVIGLQASN